MPFRFGNNRKVCKMTFKRRFFQIIINCLVKRRRVFEGPSPFPGQFVKECSIVRCGWQGVVKLDKLGLERFPFLFRHFGLTGLLGLLSVDHEQEKKITRAILKSS